MGRRVHLRVQLRLMLCVGEAALGDSGLDLRRQSLVLWSHRLDLLLDRGLDQALVVSLSFGSLALGGLGGDRGSSNIYQKEKNRQISFIWFPLVICCHRNRKRTKLISYVEFVPRLVAPPGHGQHVAPQRMKRRSEQRRRRRRGGD